ncbi:MAG: hypothetical protein QOC65_87 [Sphingomonadales bacterium]|nr:hypothetical protein [Sphingomonadales bacterium]
MAKLEKLVAAHPIDAKPYHCIKFVRVDQHGVPLYRVSRNKKEMGARAALREAIGRYGGHCFHCGTWHPPQDLSQLCTRDHLRPKNDGGGNHLHNLVVACGACNHSKGGLSLADLKGPQAAEYLRAIDKHLVRCLNALKPT